MMTRAEKVGKALGRVISAMVDLMYQTNTAVNFMRGLRDVLQKDYDKRIKMKKEMLARSREIRNRCKKYKIKRGR